jgi:hypothetical protein
VLEQDMLVPCSHYRTFHRLHSIAQTSAVRETFDYSACGFEQEMEHSEDTEAHVRSLWVTTHTPKRETLWNTSVGQIPSA